MDDDRREEPVAPEAGYHVRRFCRKFSVRHAAHRCS